MLVYHSSLLLEIYMQTITSGAPRPHYANDRVLPNMETKGMRGSRKIFRGGVRTIIVFAGGGREVRGIFAINLLCKSNKLSFSRRVGTPPTPPLDPRMQGEVTSKFKRQ